MAEYRFSTLPLESCGPSGYTVIFDGRDMPRRTVDVANLAALVAEFDKFRAELEAAGAPVMLSCTASRSVKRKFVGFDAATKRGGKLSAFVNPHKCPAEYV